MRILNVACGEHTYGTDFIDLYPKRHEVIKWDINKNSSLPYKKEVFDEVFCKGFLEHSTNVGTLISEMKRVLKKNGKLKIITDNASYWTFALKNSLHRGGYEHKDSPEDKHYCLFTDRHLRNFFELYDLKVKKLNYIFVQEESKSFFRKWFKRLVNYFLLLTLNKFAYMRLEIEGIK